MLSSDEETNGIGTVGAKPSTPSNKRPVRAASQRGGSWMETVKQESTPTAEKLVQIKAQTEMDVRVGLSVRQGSVQKLRANLENRVAAARSNPDDAVLPRHNRTASSGSTSSPRHGRRKPSLEAIPSDREAAVGSPTSAAIGSPAKVEEDEVPTLRLPSPPSSPRVPLPSSSRQQPPPPESVQPKSAPTPPPEVRNGTAATPPAAPSAVMATAAGAAVPAPTAAAAAASPPKPPIPHVPSPPQQPAHEEILEEEPGDAVMIGCCGLCCGFFGGK